MAGDPRQRLTGELPNVAPRNTKPLFLLIVLTSINHCCYAGVGFSLTLYALKLHAAPFTIGLLIALYSLFGALTAVVAGRWADRFGARWPMLLASAAMAAGAALAFFWRDLAALFLVSVIVGTAYNVYYIAQQQLLGQFGDLDDRVRTFSMSALGISIANFVGPLGVGLVVHEIDYPGAFLMLAVLPVVPVLFMVGNGLPNASPGSEAKGGRGEGHGSALGLLRDRELRLIYAISLFGASISQLFAFLMPLHGIGIGFSAFQISLAIGAFSLASAVSRLLLPLLTRSITPWSLLIGSLAVAAACFALLPFLRELVSFIVVSFFLGLMFGSSAPVAHALLYEAAPAQRVGEVLGLRAMMVAGLQTVVPVAAGAITTVIGIGSIFGGFAVVLVGCCYASRGRMRRRPANATGQ